MADRSVKTLIAVTLLVIGILVLTNVVIAAEPLTSSNWLVVFITLGGSLALWIWMWLEDRRAEEESSTATLGSGALQLPQAQEWVISAPDKVAFESLSEPVGVTTMEIETAEEAPATPESTLPEVAPPTVEVETVEVEEVRAEPSLPTSPEEHVDFTIIEGIGPKYNDTLREAGITTFAQLAAMTETELRELMQKAGYTRVPRSVESWAEQAGYVARGDLDGLKQLQEQLSGGRRGGDD